MKRLRFLSRRERLIRYIKKRPGLVCYYPLDDSSGNAINRAPATSGILNGALSGPTQGVAGKIGNAYNFDGTNDNIIIADPGTNSVLDFSSEFSIIALVKLSRGGTGAGAAPIFIKGTFNNSRTFDLNSLSTRKLEIAVADGTNFRNVASNSALTNGQWYFVGCSFKDSTNTARIYINGAVDIEDTSTINITPGITNNSIAIGSRNDSSAFVQGVMSHIGLFSRELTAAEFYKMAKLAGVA